MTESRLVCRTRKGCTNSAVYLLPMKKAAGDVGWIPVCYEDAEGWFNKRPVIGEVLEVDVVSDNPETMEHLGMKQEATECQQDAPNAEES
jgi:hypothetical protein